MVAPRRKGRLGALASLAVVALCLGLYFSATSAPSSSSAQLESLNLRSMSLGNGSFIGATATFSAATFSLATSTPIDALQSVADAPPLSSHEVFGFAPYWALHSATSFDVSGYSTIAYFSIGVNANGTLDKSDAGWAGFESQQFVNLINRAHSAGDRVVLTASCFTQGSLNTLTHSPQAQQTLAASLVTAVKSKNLNGVNIDFEGQGSGDRAGLVALMDTVTSALHGVDPHWQVTMDTYASSAGDSAGFYDIENLKSVVDGFFVMAYQLNVASKSSTPSILTDQTFPLATTIAQYAAVTAKKVILGLPTFGYSWPTAGDAMGEPALGAASIITAGNEISSGHPVYWDPYTQTAWSSYLTNGQWYQAYFMDPNALYQVAKRASNAGLSGVGMWAMGDDNNIPDFTQALDGNALVTKFSDLGPVASPAKVRNKALKIPTVKSPSEHSSVTVNNPRNDLYTGVFDTKSYSLKLLAMKFPTTKDVEIGTLSGFSTNNPTLTCLETGASLSVWKVRTNTKRYLVMATTPGDCSDEAFALETTTPLVPATPNVTAVKNS